MTGPTGDQPRGYREVEVVEPPHSLTFRDGFANADGSSNPALPATSIRVTIEPLEGERSRMTIRSNFTSREAMEQLNAMGMEGGMKQALGQIGPILAGDRRQNHE